MAGLRREAAAAVFCMAAIAAGVAPLASGTGGMQRRHEGSPPAWPAHYEGRELTEMPLSPREEAFLRGFPGRVGRFSDGWREIIIRRVDEPTRRLHSAADCLRGAGYAVTPLPARKDASGAAMGCMRASRDKDAIAVCEVIRDGSGGSWPDVSEWFWNALPGTARGPWWSYVVVEKR